jgi:hypothetical protein
MALPDAQTVLAKYKARSVAAAPDYVSGVVNTQKDIVGNAIAAIPLMQQNFNAAVQSGRVANGLRRIGTQGIKDAVQAKGSQAYTLGVQNADAKFLAGFGTLLQDEAQGLGQLPQDRSSDAARTARMLAWNTWMLGYKNRHP